MGCSVNTQLKSSDLNVRPKIIKSTEELIIEPGMFIQERSSRFEEVYRLSTIISESSVGEVRICFHRDTNEKRVVRISHQALITSQICRVQMHKEIRILKSLDHPNIIRIFDYFEDSKRLYIVTEYCKGGQLLNKFRENHSFSELEVSHIMRQIFTAVAFYHSKQVIHRDLTLNNILIGGSDNSFSIKIADFVNSQVHPDTLLKTTQSSVHYLAPEFLKKHYTAKCDLWSCGVIMYILLSGSLPFTGTDLEILAKIKKCQYSLSVPPWDNISVEAKDLISRLIAPESTRISSEQAQLHQWFSQNSSMDIPNSEVFSSAMTNLRKFSASNKLRDAVYTFVTSHYANSAEVLKLKTVFYALDKNGDGKVTKEELREAYTGLIGSAEAANMTEQIMSQVDSDKDGHIEYTEFLKASIDAKKLFSSKNLAMAFKRFDSDSSGKISPAELKELLRGSSDIEDHVWADLVGEVDQNGDGEIDLCEFIDLVTKALA